MAIGILDIGIGNIGSLQGALYSEGWDTKLVHTPTELLSCDRLIMPGVGSFFEGMRRLQNAGLVDAIRAYANAGYPILGICLGMQMLADYGDEGGGCFGLGLISGRVTRLKVGENFRLPHIGWNTVSVKCHPLFAGVKAEVDFYFVHTYFFDQVQLENQLGTTEYDVKFTSCIAKKNIVGVQFHPEKSQRNGLKMLNNFCAWNGRA